MAEQPNKRCKGGESRITWHLGMFRSYCFHPSASLKLCFWVGFCHHIGFTKGVTRHTSLFKNAWPSWLILYQKNAPTCSWTHHKLTVPIARRMWDRTLQTGTNQRERETCRGHGQGKDHVERDAATAAESVGGCVAIGRKHVTLLPHTLWLAAEQPPLTLSFSHENVYPSSSPLPHQCTRTRSDTPSHLSFPMSPLPPGDTGSV